jgi:HEAT repeat protein
MKTHVGTTTATPQADSAILTDAETNRLIGAKDLSIGTIQTSCTSLKTTLYAGLTLLILLVGCEPKQKIDHLKVGRQQLLNSGLAIDSIKHLKQAEIDELDKAPPRGLLVLAYTHALSTGAAKTQGLEPEFKSEHAQRLAALGNEEIEYLLQILVRRSRLQKDAIQVVVDKGVDALPVLIGALGQADFLNLRGDIVEMMYQIGSDGLDLMVDAIQSADTSTEVQIELVRLVGRIGEPQGLEDLETIHKNTEDAGLQMEISVTLYRLGKHEYSTAIIKGLTDDDLDVRRASARAMIHLNDYPMAQLIKALQDTDNEVVTHAAQAFQNKPDPQAVAALTSVLTGTADNAAKQAASDALRIHAEQKLAKGLTTQLIKALISGNITNAEDRLRILQLLRKEPLMNQIKVTVLVDPQLIYDLDQYLKQTETHEMVKGELSRILDQLE